mgnify:FL=1
MDIRYALSLTASASLLFITGCGDPAPTPTKPIAPPPQAAGLDPMPTPQFMQAALEGKLDQIQTALKNGTPVDTLGEGGRTALMLGAFNGHTAIVEALLKAGAAVSARDETSRTALMYASTGPNPNTVQALLSAGAKVNATDSDEHFSPLMFAAAEGHTAVVTLLLENNADPTLKDIDGDSAAVFADQRNHSELAKLLRAAEAGK